LPRSENKVLRVFTYESFIQSGQLQAAGSIQYKSFSPSPINKPFEWQDQKINLLLADAMQVLGELNTYSTLVPDVNYFIKMHIAKEAITSSRIEGTKTRMDEALRPKADYDDQSDCREIQHCLHHGNAAC